MIKFLRIFLIVGLLFVAGTVRAQLLGWNANNNGGGFGTSPWTPPVKNANITTTGLVRGSSIATGGQAAGGCWGGSGGWNTASGSTSDNNSFHFTVVAAEGYQVSISGISTATRRSGSGPSGYTLYYSVGGSAFVSAGTATTSSTSGTTGTAGAITLSTVDALQDVAAGTVIKFRITPTGSTGNYYLTGGDNALKVNGTVEVAAPVIPDAPVATAATANNTGSSFMVNWNAVTGATGYRLDVATDNAFTNILEDYDNMAVAGTSHLVNLGIQPNTTYHYRVRAEKNAETSVNSNVIDVMVGSFVLQAPVTIAGSGILTDGFMANWNATAGATGYYLDVSTSPDFGAVTESYITETFTNMPESSVVLGTRGWTGDGGITWHASLAATNRVHNGTTDRLIMMWLQSANEIHDSYLLSGEVQGDFNALTFDTYKVLNNGTNSTVTASVLSGANFETETVLGTQITPSNTTSKNTFSTVLPNVIPGPYKIKIEVTDNPAYGARTGLDNVKFGSRIVTGPLFVTGYENLNVGNVTSYLVTGLQPGTKYYYRVRAYTATETSGNSNVTDVTTGCITVAPPTASNQEVCGGSTIASLDLAEDNVHWFAAQTDGTELAPTATVTTGTYYASLFTGNCESPRVAVSVNVTTTPAIVAVPLNICGAGTIGDLVIVGTDLKWYADATTVTTLTNDTPVITGTYYVTQTLTGCESARTALTVTATPIPAAPVAADQAFCGTATIADLMPAPQPGLSSVTEAFEYPMTGNTSSNITLPTGIWAVQNFSVSNVAGNSVAGYAAGLRMYGTLISPEFDKVASVSFYARAEGAKTVNVSKMVNGSEVLIEAIPLTTTLTKYTVAVNESNNNVKIKIAPESSNVWSYFDDVEISVQDDVVNSTNWYADATGGTPLAATEQLAEGNYFVSVKINGCEGPRTEVDVTINTIPAAPVATALTLCGEPTVAQLTVTGDQLKWYAAETGGIALVDTEAVIAGNYYVSQTVNGCESPRAEVAVTINPIPAAPTASPLSFCGSATVAQLTATGDQLKWYAAETGGTALADTEAVTSTTYYVSQTIDTCESPRAAVVVTVSDLPAGPVVEALSYCGNTVASQLPVTGGTALKWYAAETGGSALTPTEAIATGNYYVSQTIDGCESLRLAVAVTVNPIPAAPSINEVAQTFCSGATVANLLPENASIKWYTAALNGTALSADTALTNGLSIYYASQTVDGCESTSRTPVAVQVNVTTLPVANSTNAFCNGATVADLEATGNALQWYESETATDVIADTVELVTNTYYVTQTLNNCESAKVPVAVTVTNPVAAGAAVQQYNTGETLADLEVTGPGILWYADEALTQVLPATTVLTEWHTYYAVPNIGTCAGEALPVQVDDMLSAGGFDIKNLQYYPNPVKDVLNVSYAEAITGVEVYNMLGQVVLTSAPNAATVQVDMAALQAGTYIVKLQSGNNTQTIKLIKK